MSFTSAARSKNSKKGAISKFELAPKQSFGRNQNTLVVDRDIIKILESSNKTLTYCNLVSCMFIGNPTFKVLAQARHLQWLCLANNPNIDDEHIISILKNCSSLVHLSISKCPRLTDHTLDELVESSTNLSYLDISHNSTMIVDFRGTMKLDQMKRLKELDISSTTIGDGKLFSVVMRLPALQNLILDNCIRLTLEGIKDILIVQKIDLKKISLHKTEISQFHTSELKAIEELRKDVTIEYEKN